MILYGKPVADNLLSSAQKKAANLPEKPLLAIIASLDDASKVYVRNKVKACEDCGMESCVIEMYNDANTQDYIETVLNLNRNDKVTGIIVQLPLPNGVDEKKVTRAITPSKDIDGLNPSSPFSPCTPRGIIHMIDYYMGKNFLSGKNAVVLGRSEIVGKPMADLLLERDATVTICHSKTQNLQRITRGADVIVSAVGRANFVTKDMVSADALIIDAGINRVDGKLCGDCDFDSLKENCDISPVPGGVGLMTVATLVNRLPTMWEMQHKHQMGIQIEKR